MVKFSNIALESLGLIVMNIQGILDMPKREGQTYYDWGNGYEPLLNESDIYFGSRDIVMDVFFDDRKADFKTTMETLESIVGDHPLETVYGTNIVRLDSVRTVREYNPGKTLQITLKELNPDLSGGLPTVTGDDEVRIDGHGFFSVFGLLVESVKLHDLSRLKNSAVTSFKSNTISVFREPQTLEIKVNGIYASSVEMTQKISALNSLLAKEGYRHFVFEGEGYQCFCDQGFSVRINGTTASAEIPLKKKGLK